MKRFIKPLVFLLALSLIIIPINPTVSYAADDDIVVEINKENFPDPVFRNFLLNGSHYVWDEDDNQIEVVYDANKDGFLSEGEIANMKQLLTAETYIKDLKGVEYLTSLIEIDCQRSSLNYMDLTSNTELLILNCYKCDLKGALDLSKNTKLEGAACHNNRELTSIDVSGCTELTSLTCDSTGVTELDLSNNPKLQSVSFADTGMTKIDLRNNPELAMISAYNTDITHLDLSANPKLEFLDASNCKLGFLDLSANPNMLYLNLSNNPLGWVNIGNNPSLEFYIDDSTISIEVPADSFDMTKYIPGIDTEKVSIVSGASLQGNIVSDYSFDTPIVYTYDCGTSSAGAEVLTVTAVLTQAQSDDTETEVAPPAKNPEDQQTQDDSDKKASDKKANKNSAKKSAKKSDKSTDKKAKTSAKNPKTGDESNLTLWVILFILTGSILAAALIKRRRS